MTVIPPTKKDQRKKAELKLYAANNNVIDTYGEKLMEITLSLKRSFPWRVIVADVSYPIIGTDFLAAHGLMSDLKGRRLVDSSTQLSSKAHCAMVNQPTVSTLGTDEFSRLLADFPGISQPTSRRQCKLSHNTTHVIETNGRPVTAKARRLPIEKLNFARKHFEELLHLGDIRPSKSSWASAIHITKKKGPEKWRVCGDYRALNSITKPDHYPVPNIADFNIRLDGSQIFTTIDISCCRQ